MQAYFESVHRQIQDERLDVNARQIGMESGIGRLSHITDEVLTEVLDDLRIVGGSRILDLGSGRGFLPRWLRWRGLDVDYVGVDFSMAAIAAARRHMPSSQFVLANFFDPLDLGEFDLVCAIEATGEGVVNEALAHAMLRSLKPSGAALATLVTLRHSFSEAQAISVAAIEAAGGHAKIRNVTDAVVHRAARLCHAVLSDYTMADDLRQRAHRECSMFLEQIESKSYGYATLIATIPS